MGMVVRPTTRLSGVEAFHAAHTCSYSALFATAEGRQNRIWEVMELSRGSRIGQRATKQTVDVSTSVQATGWIAVTVLGAMGELH